MSTKYFLSHIESLEAEAIHAIREVYAQFKNPAILFSGGKDSIVLTLLAKKAFSPFPMPFPIVHIDTGHNFPETIAYRDEFVAKNGFRLVTGMVQESIDTGLVEEEIGLNASRNALQTKTLLHTIAKNGFDACMGGARRDEEKARAKERFFSHRDVNGFWNPNFQRPEVWHLFNGQKNVGEHFRVFPLSNWTELDIWQYIEWKGITLPSLYFAHKREMLNRNGTLISNSPFLQLEPYEELVTKSVRFRTCGDITITGAVESEAKTVAEVIAEIKASTISERGGRADDKRAETAMEDRKKQGYF